MILARKSLNWRTGEECLVGKTSDISLFRFPWFSPIWYYNGKEKMPRVKMKAGFFLGYADHCGDFFTYQVLPEKKLKTPRGKNLHLHRSVIRIRNLKDDPPSVEEKLNGLKFYDNDGKELNLKTTSGPFRLHWIYASSPIDAPVILFR